MKFDWAKKRQTKYTAYAATYIVVILAVLGAVNFLANRYDKSYDSTANKQFSLSEQTDKVVGNLKRDVTVTYFDDQARFPQAKDLLERYASLSPKLHVNYIDPVKKPQQARAAGYRRDVLMLVDSGQRKEEAKSLTEEELTGALIRSLKSGERVAYFVTGSGERSLEDSGRTGYASVKEALERSNFKTRTLSLLGAAAQPPAGALPGAAPAAPAGSSPAVPKDCAVLVVAGPKYAYTKPEVDAIKAYVEHGGHALFLLDPPLNMGAREETAPNPELDNLLASWGVTVNKDLALDTTGVGQLFGLGPEVPLVTSYESHPIVRDMKEVATAFPLSRTLDVKSTDKTTVEKLFATGDNSYATNQLGSNQIRIDPKKDRKGPLTLAAAGTYNTGSAAAQGRFVVVGSSLWDSNGFLKFNGNRDLFLNTMNWLTADEDLISIRPKQPENRPLNMTARGMSSVFWLSVVFFPLGVVTSGMMVWWRRR